MKESAKLNNDLPPESAIPEGGASLESILCTEELQRRPSRPPQYEKENSALAALVSALGDSPRTILQTLAETILEITQSDSAGLSLLTKDDGGKRFYWPAIAGIWNPHVGGGTPRDFGPCGDVLDRNCTLLFTHFERRYHYLRPVIPAADECLLVPFYVAGKAVGTIWAIMHSGRRKFDAEDDRVMGSLGKFASSAYQALEANEDLKFQAAEREKVEKELRKLSDGLERQVRARTEELERRNKQLADLAHISRVSTMGELTASLAHELKQPISAAATDAETCLRWLERDQPEVTEAQAAASRVIKDVAHASHIINRLGLLFKKDVPQRELVDINRVIQEMMAMLRSEANRYSISIFGGLANGLPKTIADRVGLEQVLMNLMLNGIEATKDSGNAGKLTITSRLTEDGELLVSVSDTGVGLRPEQADQLFKAFYTSKPQGTGMGLPISRSIIESHGGRIWATTNGGPGATFQFTLPVKVAAHQTA